MPWVRFAGVALAIGVALSLLTLSPGAAQVRVPPDMTFDQGKDSPGPVTFSHARHREKVEKCQECHVKVFKMKKGQTGPLTMAKMKAGEQCGACHNGKTKVANTVVFTTEDKNTCERCHRK